MIYHKPVLLKEAIQALKIRVEGVYVDATFGGGGHSKEILKHIRNPGKLIAIDQDMDALSRFGPNELVTFIHGNFRFLGNYLRYYEVGQVDGILADLGVSSHQFDTAKRGFSYRGDASLDMRMNTGMEVTAADILNTYSEDQLVEVFSRNAEIRNSKTLASAIVNDRKTRPFKQIAELISAVEPVIRGSRNKYLSQTFQALRIEVNDEINALIAFLCDAYGCLVQGGRLVVISYHSIEDRIAKNFMKFGNAEGVREIDEYGNSPARFRMITKGVITPGQSEVNDNRRARSAKMRVAEKL